ncbi:hypothetical protein [Nonomuraea turkmeniaca]|nr:hypothetical protein [Nonomuraea turkmeniaca]
MVASSRAHRITSPIMLAAAVRLDMTVPACGIQEYMGYAEKTAVPDW